MRVQAYIELDEEVRTEEQQAAFDSFCSQSLLDYYKIHTKDGRGYYHCIIVDSEKIPTMIAMMSARNPVINGCWDIDGNPYLNESGNHEYSFDLPLHLTHTENEKYFDPESNEFVTTESPNTFVPLHGFLGWALPTKY